MQTQKQLSFGSCKGKFCMSSSVLVILYNVETFVYVPSVLLVLSG